MTYQMMKTVGAAVLVAVSAFAAAPPNKGALDITAVSNGVIIDSTNPQHVEALVSVVDNNGVPVTGVAAQFLVNNHFIPVGALCGPVFLGAQEKEPGFYTLILAIPNNQCKWQLGDYMFRVALPLGNAQGQAPLKFTVKQVPFGGM